MPSVAVISLKWEIEIWIWEWQSRGHIFFFAHSPLMSTSQLLPLGITPIRSHCTISNADSRIRAY